MLGPDPVSDPRAGLSAESAPAELLMDRPELARDSSELRQRRWRERKIKKGKERVTTSKQFAADYRSVIGL